MNIETTSDDSSGGARSAGLFRAAEAVVRSINDRRLEPLAPLLHRRVRLDFPSSRRCLRGRAQVIAHLRRLFRDLDANGPVAVAAATAMLPAEGDGRRPCALVYDGPQRSFAICPDMSDADAGIESLTVLQDPDRLAAATRMAAPRFPDTLSTPAAPPG